MRARILLFVTVISGLLGTIADVPAHSLRTVELVVVSEENAARLQVPAGFYFAPLVGRQARPMARTVEELTAYVRKKRFQVVKLRGADQQAEEHYSVIYEAAHALTLQGVTCLVGKWRDRQWDYQRTSWR